MKSCLSLGAALISAGLLSACGITQPVAPDTPPTPVPLRNRTIEELPPPKGKVLVSVYAFRDQTGQFKPAPDSSYSTAVTQGATAWLMKSLTDSGWFAPVERENLQNLLTERKIWRATETEKDKSAPPTLPPLTPAPIVIEGSVTSYESNVRTGGAGARFLGIGASGQYRVDQVTVALRAVDVRSGQILANVISAKTIWSRQLSANVFRYVSLQRLLEMEAGYTRNEPTQLCVKEAIDAAVKMLVAKGVKEKLWFPADPKDPKMAVLDRYGEDEMEIPPAHVEEALNRVKDGGS
ncbi:CsgG/HfaB family protein [Parachitinimonas caeni]|uniref:CsgG/HfaB family protein n=1 Tax=Parachitinimonas caeni TaxID=3031301 RepID=A0ABT7DXZ2_9NEIS|nr:CsgG/HfaB family protein [Parachitinimonas caeni]MDK2124942.1 CsgG/HfaB family protein [Parachitinimonas caeni]